MRCNSMNFGSTSTTITAGINSNMFLSGAQKIEQQLDSTNTSARKNGTSLCRESLRLLNNSAVNIEIDRYSSAMRQRVVQVLKTYGIPL